jgi:hypothetical protein
MDYKEVRTEAMVFFLDRWYLPDSEALQGRIEEQRAAWARRDKERAVEE